MIYKPLNGMTDYIVCIMLISVICIVMLYQLALMLLNVYLLQHHLGLSVYQGERSMLTNSRRNPYTDKGAGKPRLN